MSNEQITLNIVEVMKQLGIGQEKYSQWNDKEPYKLQELFTENVLLSQKQ